MGRASKDKRDIYYRKAKEEGYRARSAYKLLQIHEEFNILNPAEIRTGAVDLCAAPGSWSQVLANHFKTLSAEAAPSAPAAVPLPPPRIVAVDLQEMAPIEGVTILQGDITSQITANEIIRLLNAPEAECHPSASAKTDEEHNGGSASLSAASASPRKADIVICDGAPDVTGMHELDEYLQHHLLLAALHITTFVLRPGGCFVTKMFRGPNTPFLVAKSEVFFEQVRVVKPKSSRNASMESFLLCQGFRLPPGYVPRFVDAEAAAAAATASPEHVSSQRNEEAEESGASGGAPLRSSGFTPDAPAIRYAVSAAAGSLHAAGNSSTAATQNHSRTACTLPNSVLAPFLSCGDLSGFDADMCYDRAAGTRVLEPVQPPLQAPYLPPSSSAAAEEDDVDKGSSKKKLKVEASP